VFVQHKHFYVVHYIKNGIKRDDISVARGDGLNQGKRQISRKMNGGKNEKIKKGLLVVSFVLFNKQIYDMYRKNQNPENTNRYVKYITIRHIVSLKKYPIKVFNTKAVIIVFSPLATLY
jgi:hypothetical protein